MRRVTFCKTYGQGSLSLVKDNCPVTCNTGREDDDAREIRFSRMKNSLWGFEIAMIMTIFKKRKR